MPPRTETASALEHIVTAVPRLDQAYFRKSYATWLKNIAYGALELTIKGTGATNSNPNRMGYQIALPDTLAPVPGAEYKIWLQLNIDHPERNRAAFTRALRYLIDTAGPSTQMVTVIPGATANAGEQLSTAVLGIRRLSIVRFTLPEPTIVP